VSLKQIDPDFRSENSVMRRRIIWTGLVVVIFITGGFLYLTFSTFSSDSNQKQLSGETETQGAVARIGDLTLSVSGTGELVAVSETGLGFQDYGELVELNVHIGDQVQAGEVLARLHIDQSPAERAANLTNTELEVLKAQLNLDQLYDSAQIASAQYDSAQIASAQALLMVEEAQLALDNLEDIELEQALAQQELWQAEGAVQEAEMNLYILNSSPSQQALDTAFASLLFKEKELEELEDRISQVEYQFKSASDKAQRDLLDKQIKNLRAQLANQQLEYENALYKYNSLDDPPDAIDLAVAEAQLRTAQAQLADALQNWAEVQEGPQVGELAAAEAQLADAQAEWERLKNGPDQDEIELLEAQLVKAEAKLAMLQAGQLIVDLVAPMDGSVVSLNAEIGDRISNETILTLADLSQAIVEVHLDEIDRPYVQVGNRAEISFDAIPERTFQGQVIQIEPSLVRVGDSQAVRAWVLLDAEPNDLTNLPLGLNASVDIIAGETENAVLVTIDALNKNSDGSYHLYVVDGETVEARPVQIGLMDATTAEIVAGLQSGERVAIGNINFDQE
jgi:multidrug efflux pump subunit AcrA (membrane-fusion protein)